MSTTGTLEVRPQFPVLDSLRAVGAIAVLTTHTSFQSGDYLRHGVLGTLLARLDVGVAIFFVLSGFLLSRPYLARAALGANPPSTARYYRNRLLRIYPVYVVTVIVALLFVPENGSPDLKQWVTSLLMSDPYVDEQLPHGLTHMWSLAAEVAFYAVLPLFMWVVVSRNRLVALRMGALLVGMVGLSIAWHLSLDARLQGSVGGSPSIWLPAYLTWFAVGIGLAWAHVRLQQGSGHPALLVLPRLGAMPGVCWTLVVALMLLVATPLAGPTLFQVGTAGESLVKHLTYAMIGGLLVMSGIWAGSHGAYSRVMAGRLLRHVGHISYSIFCIHLAVISLVMWLTGYELFRGHGLEIWLLTAAITLAASEALYRFLELPFLRLARRRSPSADAPDRSMTANNTW